VARAEFGLLEHRQFQHDDKAMEQLSAALNGPDKLPRIVESDAYAAQAEIYLARGQKAKALAAARKAYALNATNAGARKIIVEIGGERDLPGGAVESQDQLFLVEQYMQAGDYIQAQAAARAAFEQDKRNAVAAMKAAQCLWKLGQSSDAIEWMNKAIAADPKLTLAYVELSQYYGERFDYLSAIAVLKKIQSLQPRAYEVYRGFAAIELQQNDFKAAIQLAERALQVYDLDPETFLVIAKARIGLGEYIEAQKYAGRAMEMDPSSAEAKALNAKVIAGLRGTAEGIQYAKQLILNYPYVIEYRVALAEIYTKDERWQEALDAYSEARSVLGARPDKRVFLGRGKALQALGRNSDALDSFLQAAIVDPSDAQAIFCAGGVYFDQARYAEAIAQYQRALRINPRYPGAHVQIGRADIKVGRAPAAIEEADAERLTNPNLADADILAAEARYALGDYTGCAQEYQKAVSTGYSRSRLFISLARCYRLSGSLDSALSMLRQAEALESGFSGLYKEYGAYYHTKCMTDEAVKAYNTYLSLAPGASDKAAVEGARDRAAQGNCDLAEGEGG
jgi:tetratricopeptide (TPR) repeat protein